LQLKNLSDFQYASSRNFKNSNSEPLTFTAKTLDALVAETMDAVLNELIGKKPTEAIYDYLERDSSVAREEILQNTDKLFEVIEGLFGKKGSKVVSTCIAKRVFQNLDWEFVPVEGFQLSDYIEMARARIARELVKNAKNIIQGEP
jgi:predicted lipid-binding transport protein (Tim44 family)